MSGNCCAPNINLVRGAILIGSTTNLGHGSNKILTVKNLNKSSRLPKATTRVVGTP